MFAFPEEPDVPSTQRADGLVHLRYEDVTQDGRLALEGLPHALGEVVWQNLLVEHPLTTALRGAGIVPLLTRMVVEGGQEPISIRHPLEGRGTFQLAHAPGGDGAPPRLFLNLWVRLRGPRGRTHGPPPAGAGETVYVGRVFAEHVFTRPFAPPDQRKVTRLPAVAGIEPLPAAPWSWRPAEDLLQLPAGALPLEPELAVDPTPVIFGLDHTDSNQHVNSLVYPRLFVEAALRRFDALGRPAVLLARALEIAWRKPSFAGERARIRLRAFSAGDALGAAGLFEPEGGAARPHATVRALFEGSATIRR